MPHKNESRTGATTAANQLVTITVTSTWLAVDREWDPVEATYTCDGCGDQKHVNSSEYFDALDQAMKAHARQCRTTPAAPRGW